MILRSLHADLSLDPINVEVIAEDEHKTRLSFSTPEEDFVELYLSDAQLDDLFEKLVEGRTTWLCKPHPTPRP